MTYLFNNQQIQAVLGLELVGDILQQPGQLNVVLLVHGPTKHGQIVQPHGDGGAV